MISNDILFYGSLGLSLLPAVAIWQYRANKAQSIDLPEARELGDPVVREQLTRFLQQQKVSGDANIRNGVVIVPVPANRLSPLVQVLKDAVSRLARLRNPAACSLYVRDSVSDRWMLLGDLDLGVLQETVSVLERVAEDRIKSRSIYKGLTDEEINAMVRAGFSQYLKDEGKFSDANDVMSGAWDESQVFEMAAAVLDLALKVKSAGL